MIKEFKEWLKSIPRHDKKRYYVLETSSKFRVMFYHCFLWVQLNGYYLSSSDPHEWSGILYATPFESFEDALNAIRNHKAKLATPKPRTTIVEIV